MTVAQARAEGLIFTGIWERDYRRNEVRAEAKKIREKYKCRAVLVDEEGGVSVYADRKYETLQRLETLECRLNNIPTARQNLLDQLAELDERESALKEQITAIKTLYGIE